MTFSATQDYLTQSTLPEISPATNEDIIAYLRYSHNIADISARAERDTLILSICQQFNITVADEELQAAGDAFRQEHKLLGTAETLAWLQAQRITVEDWSQGIRIALLTKKLKEYLFGDVVDAHYINNRNDFKRVALSQILVRDLPEALKVFHVIQQNNASFCTLALEYSKGKHSQQNGGFVGIRFLSELMPEIVEAISEVREGVVVEPIQTKLGYHIIRIEKWFPTEFNELVREEILASLFAAWLKEKSNY